MTTGFSKTKEEERHATKNRTNDRRENFLTAPGSNRSMKLGALFEGIEASISASTSDLDIRQVACDSRKVRPHALFFALHGAKADGNAFIRDVIARGAVAIASEEAPPLALPPRVAWIRLHDVPKPLALAAANLFGHPGHALQLAAVTRSK